MSKKFVPGFFGWMVVAVALLPVIGLLYYSLDRDGGRRVYPVQQIASPVDPGLIDKDTAPPSVSITSPSAGASLSGTVTISADASDDVAVASVDFYQSGNLISTDTSLPYSVSWDTSVVGNGSYSLTARASDGANNQTTSGAISVSVSNQSNPPTNPNPPAGNSNTDPNNLADNTRVLFIDKNNASCSDSGARSAALNPNTPWCTPTGMNENNGRKFQPGDVVYVKAGDYSIAPLALYSAGSSGSAISWRPYPGDSVTIRGTGASTALITLMAGANYWTIDGLNFTDSSANLLFDVNQSSGLTVRNARFGPGRSGSSLIRLSGGGSNSLFENNDIFCVSGSSGVAGGDGIIFDNVQNSVVRNNRFGNCGHVSLNLRNSGNNLVERNTIENGLHTSAAIINIPGNPGSSSGNIFRQNLVRNFNTNPSEPSLPGIGLEILYASNNSVYNNIFTAGANSATGLTIAADSSIGQSNNNKVYNNTFYQTGGRGIDIGNFGSSGSSNGVTGNKIYNNIIVNTDNSSNRNAPIVLNFPAFEENNGYGNEIKNNLLIAGDATVVKSRGANAALRFSYTAANLNTQTFAANNLNSDPQFASTGASFPLSSNSPAGNAGFCQGEVNSDYNGNSRPSSGCDIGAFESVAGAVAPLVAAICGNGQVEAGEQCDGANLAGASCSNLGFLSGSLSCTSQCRYATGQCLVNPLATTTIPVATTTLKLPVVPIIPPLVLKPPKVTPPVTPVTKKPTTSKPSEPAPALPAQTGCQERWLCRESWSECVDGKQTRECTERSTCGTTLRRPPVERACSITASGETIPASEAKSALSLNLNLNLTEAQSQALSVLIPTFFITLAVLVSVVIRLWL